MSIINSKKIFYINSRNRSTGTDSDFTYTLNLPGQHNYNRVVVLQMNIPKSYYAIQSGLNTFTLKEDTTEYVVTIPIGSYTKKSFQVVIESVLNNSGSYTYTVNSPNASVAAETGLYTYSVSGNSGNTVQFIFNNNNIADSMGFARTSVNSFTSSITSTQVINMQKETTLFLHSDISSNETDNILQEVYVADNPNFSSIAYQCIDVEAYNKELTSRNSNTYRFRLSDEDDNLIDTEGNNIVITIMLYQANNVYQLIKRYLGMKLLDNI